VPVIVLILVEVFGLSFPTRGRMVDPGGKVIVGRRGFDSFGSFGTA